MSTASVEELTRQVEEYETQLAMVTATLREDPDNEELLVLQDNLKDVISASRDVLKLKQEAESAKTSKGGTYTNIHDLATRKGMYVGLKCLAKYEDGEWYKCTIMDITSNGFKVLFTEYGNTEFVAPDDIKHDEKEVIKVEASKAMSQAALHNVPGSSKFVVDEQGKLVIPASMRILPTDSEAVRKQKKKRIKKLKSEFRLGQLETDRNKRKGSWQEFLDRGKTKHQRKTPSIFASPDTIEGRVGFTGSGQGITEFRYQKYEPKKLSGPLPTGTRLQGDNPWQ